MGKTAHGSFYVFIVKRMYGWVFVKRMLNYMNERWVTLIFTQQAVF